MEMPIVLTGRAEVGLWPDHGSLAGGRQWLDHRSSASNRRTCPVGIGQCELMLEGQREIIRKAVEAGKCRGRANARRKSDAVQELRQAGLGPAEIARRLPISRASVYRVIGAQTAP